MLRAVSFDLYGTLVDILTNETAPETTETFAAWVERRWGRDAARREREHPFAAALRGMRPPPVLHAEPDIEPVAREHLRGLRQAEPAPSEVAELAEAFRAASRRQFAPIPGAREALLRLRGRFRVGLISNAQRLFTLPELRLADLDPAGFDPLLISSDVGERKPGRGIFERALAAANVRPDEALHVGNDAHDDVDGAAGAGLHTCLVDDPRRAGDGERPPDLRLHSVAELPDLLLGTQAPRWAR